LGAAAPWACAALQRAKAAMAAVVESDNIFSIGSS
jgi:hypothetical protein